jgi:hypothetical protein
MLTMVPTNTNETTVKEMDVKAALHLHPAFIVTNPGILFPQVPVHSIVEALTQPEDCG